MSSTNGTGKQPEQSQTNRHDEIELRAYQLWQERGSPIGTPEEDWLRAEEEIFQENEQPAATGGKLAA